MAADPIRKINLVRIAHVYYKYQDVDKARTFAEDFGFSETARNGARTYYRGYGTEPFVLCVEAASESVFGGAAFVVESEEDLHYASKNLPKETKPSDVYELTDAPGGGKCVTFYDPADGFPFHLVHGQTPVELRDPNFTAQKVNYVSLRPVFVSNQMVTANTGLLTASVAHREEPPSEHIPAIREAASTSPQARPLRHVCHRLQEVLRILLNLLQLLPQRGKRDPLAPISWCRCAERLTMVLSIYSLSISTE